VKVDRRILKTQEALKKALTELMAEKSFDHITIQDLSDKANVSRGTIYLHYVDKYDLLDKLIAAHINELRRLCIESAHLSFTEAEIVWFEYFEANYLFFSTMLVSKGAPYFRTQFLEFMIDELREEVDMNEARNRGLNEEVVVRYAASAVVGIMEWWFLNDKPLSPVEMAEQIGMLLDRKL
jgi:AcrR family transcriptional regulator